MRIHEKGERETALNGLNRQFFINKLATMDLPNKEALQAILADSKRADYETIFKKVQDVPNGDAFKAKILRGLGELKELKSKLRAKLKAMS